MLLPGRSPGLLHPLWRSAEAACGQATGVPSPVPSSTPGPGARERIGVLLDLHWGYARVRACMCAHMRTCDTRPRKYDYYYYYYY